MAPPNFPPQIPRDALRPQGFRSPLLLPVLRLRLRPILWHSPPTLRNLELRRRSPRRPPRKRRRRADQARPPEFPRVALFRHRNLRLPLQSGHPFPHPAPAAPRRRPSRKSVNHFRVRVRVHGIGRGVQSGESGAQALARRPLALQVGVLCFHLLCFRPTAGGGGGGDQRLETAG
ncbi:unnamed protein product [Linum tenue]|uniref:Uncharacterized protein n=1 Tax=Linum tenue TaxID=586396 RepID=A0AAV0NFE9_9ROSI|nr:unnamed protein product [Linum tenue]